VLVEISIGTNGFLQKASQARSPSEKLMYAPGKSTKLVVVMILVCCVLYLPFSARQLASQTRAKVAEDRPAAYNGPRTPDGKPDLNGIWQALNTADWDLRPHSAGPSPVVAMGAIGAEPPGMGVLEDNDIPYLPLAAAKQKENAANWITLDPDVKCFLPGIPRATYLPYPFQIVQTPKYVLIAYEYASASRSIPIASKKEDSPVDTWMGDSYGRWEGNTFVVDVSSFNDRTWFDHAGDFHSDALHVVERYTPVNRNVLMYEATIEDSKIFTRPWKISMPLYRHVEKNAQLLEFKCVEFAEELMYGPLRKQPASK
jgi:hypothetical protein